MSLKEYTCGRLQFQLIAIGCRLKKYIQDNFKVDLGTEKCFFDEYIPEEELEAVIKRQHKVIEYQKKNDHKIVFLFLFLMILPTVKRFQETHLY